MRCGTPTGAMAARTMVDSRSSSRRRWSACVSQCHPSDSRFYVMARRDLPRWPTEQLDAGRQQALSIFISSWGVEGTRRYQARVHEFTERVRALFAATSNLVSLSGETFTNDASLIEAARFLTAPPVSADDLRTLVGGSLSKTRPDPARA